MNIETKRYEQGKETVGYEGCSMIKIKPYSSTILTVGGLLLMGMGIYFVLLRPALLSEDVQYMKTSVLVINEVPGLSH